MVNPEIDFHPKPDSSMSAEKTYPTLNLLGVDFYKDKKNFIQDFIDYGGPGYAWLIYTHALKSGESEIEAFKYACGSTFESLAYLELAKAIDSSSQKILNPVQTNQLFSYDKEHFYPDGAVLNTTGTLPMLISTIEYKLKPYANVDRQERQMQRSRDFKNRYAGRDLRLFGYQQNIDVSSDLSHFIVTPKNRPFKAPPGISSSCVPFNSSFVVKVTRASLADASNYPMD